MQNKDNISVLIGFPINRFQQFNYSLPHLYLVSRPRFAASLFEPSINTISLHYRDIKILLVREIA